MTDSDFTSQSAQLAASISLGYEVESEGAGFPYVAPSAAEIDWLAAWLVSEGWRQLGR